MDDLQKALGDIVGKEVTGLGASKPMPSTTPLRQTMTARDRVDNAITELETTIKDLTTLVATLNAIKEKL